MKSGNLNFLEPSGPFQACKETALPLLADIVWLNLAIIFEVLILLNINILAASLCGFKW